MSRHSLPWNRTDTAAADTASTKSGTSTHKSTANFFYPPLTPPATTSSNQAMSQQPLVPASPQSPPPLPPPHPYQAYAPVSYDYHSTPGVAASSHTHLSPGRYPSAGSTVSSTSGDADKASHSTVHAQPTYVIHHHHHHHHPMPPPPPPPPARDYSHPPPPHHRHPDPPSPRRTRSPLLKSRPLILLILFLPLPPLLSILYLLTGHAILRRASPSPSWSTAPLLSSAHASATGGAILSLPLFLLLFLLLFPVPSSFPSSFSSSSASPRPTTSFSPPTSTPRPADFFDDSDSDSDSGSSCCYGYGLTRLGRRRTGPAAILTYAACAGLVLGVGGAAGALGVTCLGRDTGGGSGSGTGSGSVKKTLMLSPGKAAEAGVVGGVVVWAGVLVVAVFAVGMGVLVRYVRRGSGSWDGNGAGGK